MGLLRARLTGVWMGIDVGGERKGFDVAVLDANMNLADVGARLDVPAVVELIRSWRPLVVAIDSPRRAAPTGEHLRECERQLNRAICGIRWTPDSAAINSSSYYSWIRCGFSLYDALRPAAGTEVIEVFPTASWTRWIGKRVESRARWSREGLANLPISGVPARNNQDFRDAVAAAVTAWQYSKGQSEKFGDIVVPVAGLPSR
jgi:predicted nuclease with RNAse H fold